MDDISGATHTASATQSGRPPALTVALFVIYAALMIGVILFKVPFKYTPPSGHRELNLIPFAGSYTPGGAFKYDEVIENVLVFVPFASYLCMLFRSWSLPKKVLVVVATTIFFETTQYIFSIGRADITDVLGNTLGGLLGIGIYAALSRIAGARTNRILNIAGVVLTVGALALFALILRGTIVGR